MNRRPKIQPRKQSTSDELANILLDFLQRKFYEGHAVNFAKDRRRLLDWVVLWPAKWFQNRGVTIPEDRYSQIFFKVFLDAKVFGQEAGQITYLPGYLAKVLQSHFTHHGEDYYEEAKSMRSMVEQSIATLGKIPTERQPDPVSDLATAAALLKTKKRPTKRPVKEQLSLL